MQNQLQSNWCWAACACSISAFFSQTAPTPPWTQCNLVNKVLNRVDCCTNGSSKDCNKNCYAEQGLTQTKNFRSSLPGAASKQDIQNELTNGNPIMCEMHYIISGILYVHFVVIDGYNPYTSFLSIKDPDPSVGPSQVLYDIFTSAYKGIATWSYTYYVKP